MKKFLLFVILGLATACGSDAELVVGERTTMEVKQEFDAGDVLKGEMIEAEFIVKNTGKHPLVLGEVTPSCSCTVPDYTDEPIMPGEEGYVKARVNTSTLEVGLLYKTIRIVANTTPKNVVQLAVKANILKNK